MAPVPILNAILMETRFSWQGKPVENTMGLLAGEGTEVGDFVDFATTMAELWAELAAPLCSTSLSLVEYYFTDLRTIEGGTYSYVPPTPLTGGSDNPSCSNNIALAISFRTGFRGRSFRGRNYLPGLTENQLNNNRVEAGWMNGWLAYYAQMFGQANANLTPMGVISRRRDGVQLNPGTIQPINAILYVNNRVDTQRRRLPRD